MNMKELMAVKEGRNELDNPLTPVLREKEVVQSLKTNEPNSKPVDKGSKALLYGYDNMARTMQDFMYEGRPGRSKLKKHSEKEYQKFLEKMVLRCWENYNEGVKALTDKQKR